MKNINNISKYLTRGSLLVVAVAGLALLGNSAVAQEKGAERLVNLQKRSAAPAVKQDKASDKIAMACPKCKDSWVSVVQPLEKNGRQETAKVLRHECPGCKTKLVTEGVGKQAQDKVVHQCTQCGSENATGCATKPGAGATKGMESPAANKH